jgi:hypothetical protein
MPDDPKAARAAELQKAIEEHDKRKADANVDLAKESGGGGGSGEHLDKMLSRLDDCIKAFDSMSSRLDALEARRPKDDDARKRDDAYEKRDDESDEEYHERIERLQRQGRSPGEAVPVVADAARRHALADAQTRVDAVALRFGQRSDAPLHGETVRAYRKRQLRRYQKYSPMYKLADLDSITDEQVFSGVEERIFADACAAADSPDSIQRGTLRMRTKVTDSGHRVNEFFGEPQAWMDRFGGSRRYVTKINPRGSD